MVPIFGTFLKPLESESGFFKSVEPEPFISAAVAKSGRLPNTVFTLRVFSTLELIKSKTEPNFKIPSVFTKENGTIWRNMVLLAETWYYLQKHGTICKNMVQFAKTWYYLQKHGNIGKNTVTFGSGHIFQYKH